MTSIHPHLPITALEGQHAITAPPNILAMISNMPAKCVAAGRVKHWYLATASYTQLSSGVTYYQLVTNKAYYGNSQCVQPLFTYPTDYTDLKGETTKGQAYMKKSEDACVGPSWD